MLWQWPWASATVELALVAGGAWLYWNAAKTLPEDGGRTLGRGRLVALLILLGGAATLLLDFTGLLG